MCFTYKSTIISSLKKEFMAYHNIFPYLTANTVLMSNPASVLEFVM